MIFVVTPSDVLGALAFALIIIIYIVTVRRK